MREFVLLSDWIDIEIAEIPDEMKECVKNKDDYIQPCFKFEGITYWLSNFYRCHNNSWGNIDVPDYINGVDMENYYNPYYIEIDPVGEHVRIYSKR